MCETLHVPFVALKTITDLADVPHGTVDQFLANLHTASDRLTEHLVRFVDELAGKSLDELDG